MVRYGAWQIGFFNPGMRPDRQDLFGCATLGAVTGRQYHMPSNTGLFMWGEKIRGCVFWGRYDEVLAGVTRCAFKPTLMLALFARSEGVESFLAGLCEAMPGVSIVGGVAARGDNQTGGELIPDAEDVALFMSESAVYTTAHRNVLEAHGGIYECDAESPRVLKRLRQPDMPWEDAMTVVARLKESYRVAPDDYESFTFSNNEGINLHFHVEGDRLVSGVNLPEKGYLHLRTSNREVVARSIVEYAQMPGTLIIGCAGLKKLINRPFSVPDSSTMVFLRGEVAGGELGNLMLTSIRK